jgi:hypothetical protein
MDELLGREIEPETNATCSDCAMCAPAGAPPDPTGLYFSPIVKCCTFRPVLPNFVVGRILRDAAPERARGRASVQARIAEGIVVTPLGLGRTTAQDCPDQGFGRDEAFVCPHFVFEDGTCGIWPHREATCATFFCKVVRGSVGADFWAALHRLLDAAEQSLIWHCLETLDVGDDALARLLAPAGDARQPMVTPRPDGTYAPEDRRALWGRWAGREAALYEAAADVVERLSWRDVLERGGPELRLRARLARDAHARLRAPSTPPGPLRLGTFVVADFGPAEVRLVTYSASDPLSLPRELYDALPAFEGRAAADALAAIETDHGLAIEPGVVGRLIDYEVLVPAPAPPRRPV